MADSYINDRPDMLTALSELIARFSSERALRRWCLVILAIAALFIAINVAHWVVLSFDGTLADPLRSTDWHLLHIDRSVPEIYEYVLLFIGAVAMARAATISGQPIYLALSVFMLIFMLDNALGVHEAVGDAIPVWVGALDEGIGQVLAFAALGVAFCATIVIASWFSTSAHRIQSALILACLAMAGLFAIVVDYIQFLYDWSPFSSIFLALLEESGELLGIALATCLALITLDKERHDKRG